MDEKLFELCNDKQYLGNNNFVIPNELTVTITLDEYRQLVSTAAKAELYKAQKTEFEMKQEIDRLKTTISQLQAAHYTVTNPYKVDTVNTNDTVNS